MVARISAAAVVTTRADESSKRSATAASSGAVRLPATRAEILRSTTRAEIKNAGMNLEIEEAMGLRLLSDVSWPHKDKHDATDLLQNLSQSISKLQLN